MNRPCLAIGFITDGEAFHGASPEERALGGSETALVQMGRALAQRGHRVQVFCRCPEPGMYHGVRYRDRKELVHAVGEERFEVLVISRFFAALDLPLQAGLKILWNHDILDKPSEMKARLDLFDLALVLSRFHAQDYISRLPECAAKLAVTRNGLDLELIARATRGVNKVPGLVTYVSRPERGLKLLLKHIWPRIKEARPEMRLALCGYQIKDTELHPAIEKEYAEINELIERAYGVEALGALPKDAYYRHLASCQALLYPCTFPEISCIAALEAQAVGTPIITSNSYALSETVYKPEFLVSGRPGSDEYLQSFIRQAIELLSAPQRAGLLAQQAREEIWQRHDWALVAAEWEALCLEKLHSRIGENKSSLAVSMLLAGNRQGAGRLLGKNLLPVEEGQVPPDPAEDRLIDELARLAAPAMDRRPGQVKAGILAADGGRTAEGLAHRLPDAVVEELIEPRKASGLDLIVLRDVLERQDDPSAYLTDCLAACAPEAVVVLCVASGAWPLLSAGYLGRYHDLGRDEIKQLLPGRPMRLAFVPRGLVGNGAHRYHAGRWLVATPADGPPPGWLDPGAAMRRARPAPDHLVEEVQRVGLI
jgi:glycosyltransferase involved in cell wall biosynthesis